MQIPKKITKDNKEYAFIQECNNNVFLYEENKTGFKRCFNKHELGVIDNKKIDRALNIKDKRKAVKVYDSVLEEDTIYENIDMLSAVINYSVSTITTHVNNKKMLGNRYLVEYVKEEKSIKNINEDRKEECMEGNNLINLNDFLFEQLKKLNSDNLTQEELDTEIKVSKQVVSVSQTIINNANLLLQAKKHFDQTKEDNSKIAPLLSLEKEQ